MVGSLVCIARLSANAASAFGANVTIRGEFVPGEIVRDDWLVVKIGDEVCIPVMRSGAFPLLEIVSVPDAFVPTLAAPNTRPVGLSMNTGAIVPVSSDVIEPRVVWAVASSVGGLAVRSNSLTFHPNTAPQHARVPLIEVHEPPPNSGSNVVTRGVAPLKSIRATLNVLLLPAKARSPEREIESTELRVLFAVACRFQLASYKRTQLAFVSPVTIRWMFSSASRQGGPACGLKVVTVGLVRLVKSAIAMMKLAGPDATTRFGPMNATEEMAANVSFGLVAIETRGV